MKILPIFSLLIGIALGNAEKILVGRQDFTTQATKQEMPEKDAHRLAIGFPSSMFEYSQKRAFIRPSIPRPIYVEIESPLDWARFEVRVCWSSNVCDIVQRVC